LWCSCTVSDSVVSMRKTLTRTVIQRWSLTFYCWYQLSSVFRTHRRRRLSHSGQSCVVMLWYTSSSRSWLASFRLYALSLSHTPFVRWSMFCRSLRGWTSIVFEYTYICVFVQDSILIDAWNKMSWMFSFYARVSEIQHSFWDILSDGVLSYQRLALCTTRSLYPTSSSSHHTGQSRPAVQ